MRNGKPKLKAHERTLMRWWSVANDGEDKQGWLTIAAWCDGASSYLSDQRVISASGALEDFELAERIAQQRAGMCKQKLG